MENNCCGVFIKMVHVKELILRNALRKQFLENIIILLGGFLRVWRSLEIEKFRERFVEPADMKYWYL